jgi:hypothetical protein
MCFLSGMFLCLCLMWRVLSLQVLYVGDHIYGDILRSKKELGMLRTAFLSVEKGGGSYSQFVALALCEI